MHNNIWISQCPYLRGARSPLGEGVGCRTSDEKVCKDNCRSGFCKKSRTMKSVGRVCALIVCATEMRARHVSVKVMCARQLRNASVAWGGWPKVARVGRVGSRRVVSGSVGCGLGRWGRLGRLGRLGFGGRAGGCLWGSGGVGSGWSRLSVSPVLSSEVGSI